MMAGRQSIALAAAIASASVIASAGRRPEVRQTTQPTVTRPRVTGISHAAFRVSDPTATGRFYGEILGLPLRPASADPRMTFLIGTRQRVVLEPGLPASEDERLSHLAFETADVVALNLYLTSRGLAVQTANDCQEGAIRATDPDGHVIEFVQARWPPAPPDSAAGRALSGRLLHAGLTIRDEQAAHRFYRDTLGFGEIWRGGRKEGVTQWVNMRVPDGTDYLEYMLVTSPPDRRQLGSLHHIALLVPDIQAAWEEAVRRTPEPARTLLSPPNVGVNGRWQLNLFDPDGTRAELMEPFTVR